MSTPNIILNNLMTPSPPAHNIESPVEDASTVKQPLERFPMLTIGSNSELKILHSFAELPPAKIYSLPVSVWLMNLEQNTLQLSPSLNIPDPFQSTS